MAVLTIPGWRNWGRRSRDTRERGESASPGKRRRGTSMGTRRRDGNHGRFSLPSVRHALVLIFRAMAAGLVLFLLLAATGWVVQRPMFQIQRAMVTGDLQQADQDLVIKRARVLRGNFFTVDLAAAAAELQTIPWVRSVSLRRVWPNGLEVQVEEHHALARWGDQALVNRQGEVFTADYSGDLPRFDGPAGSGPEMAQALQRFDQELAPLHRQVGALGLSERGAWTIRLDDGLVLALGRDSIHERLRRFVQVYPIVFQNGAPGAVTVDLRYPHGFALRTADSRG